MVACLLSVYNGQSYAQKNDFKIKVGVYVRGEEHLNGLIESYISKELRSLDNIIVTYSKLDCVIDIVVKELTNGNGGGKNGYALSVTIVDRFDTFQITRAIKELDTIIPKIITQTIVIKQLEELSEELVGIAISTAKIKSYHNSFLYTGSASQLRELCLKVVADFNNEYLKGKRKVMQRRYY
ncbi:MAG: hypothetical protein ACE5KZ_00825 [Candidatus Scalinduaceae bacterium]